MYASARAMPSRRVASRSRSGSGTRSSIAATISGDVPHVTCGRTAAAANTCVVSYRAPSSDTSVRQCATARSHIAPVGANGRPFP